MTLTIEKPVATGTPKKIPKFHVVVWDSDVHSFEYCRDMLQKVFKFDKQEAKRLTNRIDKDGRTIVMTTSKEHGELKVDQVQACGVDHSMIEKGCSGPMRATLEAADDE